jgi:hypothetical protein
MAGLRLSRGCFGVVGGVGVDPGTIARWARFTERATRPSIELAEYAASVAEADVGLR